MDFDLTLMGRPPRINLWPCII